MHPFVLEDEPVPDSPNNGYHNPMNFANDLMDD